MFSKALYISNIEAKTLDTIFDNIVIDAHSLDLLKKGLIDQRYAVVGFVNEESEPPQLHLYFRPSFEEGEENHNRRLFDKKDIVESQPQVTGIVHSRVVQSVETYYQESVGHIPSYLYTERKIGLSFRKYNNYMLSWLNRSMFNSNSLFSLNLLGKYVFYYDAQQDSFACPILTNAVQMERSLETNAFQKIINSVQKKFLEKLELKALPEYYKDVELKLDKVIKKQCENYFFSNEWKKISQHKELIAQNLMRTIYIAAGLKKPSKKLLWPQADGHIVIKNVVEIAKDEGIELNFEMIPIEFFDYEVYPPTALGLATLKDDLVIMKTLIDAKANINITVNKKLETLLMIAIQRGHSATIRLLIDNKADITAKNSEGISALLYLINNSNDYTLINSILTRTIVNFTKKNSLLDNQSATQVLFFKIMSHVKKNEINILNEIKRCFPKRILKNILNFKKPNTLFPTLLHYAADRDNTDIMRWLIENGSIPPAEMESPYRTRLQLCFSIQQLSEHKSESLSVRAQILTECQKRIFEKKSDIEAKTFVNHFIALDKLIKKLNSIARLDDFETIGLKAYYEILFKPREEVISNLLQAVKSVIEIAPSSKKGLFGKSLSQKILNLIEQEQKNLNIMQFERANPRSK